MFRSTPAVDAPPANDVLVLADLVPLSVLALDVDPPSVGGLSTLPAVVSRLWLTILAA
jgi:hypothetical protein